MTCQACTVYNVVTYPGCIESKRNKRTPAGLEIYTEGKRGRAIIVKQSKSEGVMRIYGWVRVMYVGGGVEVETQVSRRQSAGDRSVESGQ